jgi:hypothetical protein
MKALRNQASLQRSVGRIDGIVKRGRTAGRQAERLLQAGAGGLAGGKAPIW